MTLNKLFTFFVFTIILSGLAGNLSSQLITNFRFIFSVSGITHDILPLIVVLILLSILIGFMSILIQELSIKLLSLAIIVTVFLIAYLFGNTDNILPLIAVVSTIALFTGALFSLHSSVTSTYLNQIEPKLGTSLSNGSSKFMKIFALMLALNFFLVNHNTSNVNDLKNEVIDQIIKPTTYIVEKQMTDEAIKTNKIPSSLMEGDVASIINQKVKESGVDLSKLNTGLAQKPIDTSDLTRDLGIQIRQQITMMLDPYTDFIVPMLTILYFFTLTALFSVARIFTPAIATTVGVILTKTNIIKRSRQTVEVTRLSL